MNPRMMVKEINIKSHDQMVGNINVIKIKFVIYVFLRNFIKIKHQFPSGGTHTPRGTCWAVRGYTKNKQ